MNKKFKEFKAGDLFEIKGVRQAKSQSAIPSDPNGLPYVVQTVSNNMVSRFVNKQYLIDNDEPVCEGNCIVLGVTTPVVSYQAKEFGASQVITARADFLNEKIGLYFAIIFEKQLTMFSYNHKPGIQIYKDMMLPLPVDKNGEIDFEYMEECISPLQTANICLMEKFRKQMHFDDCKMTDADENILTKKVTFKPFKMGTLFEKLKAPYKGNGRKQDNVSKKRNTEYSLPLINCKDGNNGVMYYGRKADFVSYSNVISIIYNGPPTEGQSYFQDEIGLYTDAYIVNLKNGGIPNREVGLYLTAAINKSIHNVKKKKYSRGNKATWENKVENDEIMLPTDKNGKPDWKYMENYIRAIEKRALHRMELFEKTDKRMGSY